MNWIYLGDEMAVVSNIQEPQRECEEVYHYGCLFHPAELDF